MIFLKTAWDKSALLMMGSFYIADRWRIAQRTRHVGSRTAEVKWRMGRASSGHVQLIKNNCKPGIGKRLAGRKYDLANEPQQIVHMQNDS